jgi:hypothetical protein
MAKEVGAADGERRFARVVAAFADDSSVSRRRMFSSDNVLSVGGKIFAMLARGDLVVKLPRPRAESLVAARKGRPFDPGHGRLMREWVSVAPGGSPWLPLAREAHAFVSAAPAARRPRGRS